MDKQNRTEIIGRYLAGELNDSERREFEQWLQTDAEHRRLFDAYKKIWEGIAPTSPAELPDIDQAWAELEKRLGIQDAAVKKAKPKRFVLRWAAVAAAASLIAFFVVQTYFMNPYQIYATKNAQKLKIYLPDSSRVVLNAASEIKYRKAFDDTVRSVFLHGQAFFNVAKESRPFVVNTDNARIRVLGTRFDVWSRQRTTRVVVEEGTVLFGTLKAEQPAAQVILHKNEKSVINENRPPTPPETVDAQYLLGWLDNRFVFYKTPLKEIIKEIERRYDVRIVLDSETLANRTISGSFEEQDVESAIKYFCIALNVSYTFDGQRYIIKE